MNRFILTTRRLLTGLGGAVLIGVVLASCSKSDNDIPETPAAGLMAFNLAPDKASIGFSLSGNVLPGNGLAYTSFTGGYQAIFTGNRAAEAIDFITGNSITTTPGNFEADSYYSLFLVGANGVYKNVIAKDNFEELSGSSGNAYVRFINAIPDSSQPAVTIAANGTNIVNTNAAYASVSAFTAVTPGSIVINVNNNGPINANRTITVEAKKTYTILLLGVPGSTDTDKAVQIRFIENGTLSESSGGE